MVFDYNRIRTFDILISSVEQYIYNTNMKKNNKKYGHVSKKLDFI